ncbi:MAG TPA: hypothetical protein DEA96_15605 [Leptospiraceae bacterium]|nr:hypothetical protein [Spirochaetaceae bacterium]HBS06393.1 hypothetical protein [Leptospiraceae bacterium]|tara:strand:- start:69 stop:488 length:420 start_codon:yes stop_codon:yes gene_type:complete
MSLDAHGPRRAIQSHRLEKTALSIIVALFIFPAWWITHLVDPAFPVDRKLYLFVLIFLSGPPLLWAWLFLKGRYPRLGLSIVPAGFLLRIVVLALIFFSFEDPDLRSRAMVVFLLCIGTFLIFEVASALWVGIYGRGQR